MKNPKGYHVTHEEYLTTHQGKVSLACPIFSTSEKITSFQQLKIIKLLTVNAPKMARKCITQKLIFGLHEKYTYQVGKP